MNQPVSSGYSLDSFFLDRMIFGGSFDPPHEGHFRMARYILENQWAERLDFVPAAVSPFKIDDPPAPPEDRFRMLQMGVDHYCGEVLRARIQILDLEIRRPPPSYTVETCARLRDEFPGERIGLLLGSDSFKGFGRWKNVEGLLQHHPVAVFMRIGDTPETMKEVARNLAEEFSDVSPEIHLLDNPWVDCSSTEIKRMIQSEGRKAFNSLGKCVPPSILDLIEAKGLYSIRGGDSSGKDYGP